MAKKLYPEENIQAIASAIRAKNGSSDTYTIGEMAQAIEDIPSGIAEFDISGTTFNGYKAITSIEVPDGMTNIGASAFNDCQKLEYIYIPNGVTSIGGYAFFNCIKLNPIDFPDSLTSIGYCTFENCFGFTSIDLPDSLTSIASRAFKNCSSLATIISRNTTPPGIDSDTFQGVPADAAIYVPAESVEAYKAAQYWSARANYIQAIPSEG